MEMKKFAIALAALALFAGQSPAQPTPPGVAAWQRGDFAGAIANWRPLAEKGDADAAFNLGQAYRLGKGVPVDLAAAQRWFVKAASAGHVDAATSLGILLFQNGDRAGAMRWLKQSAVAGEPRALLLYGTALYNGDGVARDPVTAYAYVSRAAAQGLAPARATLADMDSMMPLAQRQKGIAMAQAEAAKTPKRAPAKTVVARAPTPKPATTAPISEPDGGWRIQLGAFSKRSSAESLFRSLSLPGKRAYYVPVGAVTRLQVGPYSGRAAASAACARLSGQPCFPVAAR